MVQGPGGSLAVHHIRGEEPKAAVVLIHGFAQNHASFECRDRSFLAYLASHGLDVFAPDLRGVGQSNGAPLARSFRDYVDEDLPAVVRYVHETGGRGPLFLVGHSLGGAVACAFAGRHKVSGVVTISGVYAFGSASRLIRAIARFSRCLPNRQARIHTDTLGHILAFGQPLIDVCPDLLFPLRAWARGSMAGGALRQAIRDSFAPVSSLMGRELLLFALGEVPRDHAGVPYFQAFERADCPLLVIASESDSLVPPSDARQAFERSTSRDRTYILLDRTRGLGHLDILIGDLAPELVWRPVVEWIKARL